jgi:glutathione-specific gamma-glutamylcyclotransferase
MQRHCLTKGHRHARSAVGKSSCPRGTVRHSLTLTAEMVAEIHRLEADPGPDHIELSSDDYRDAAQLIADQNAGRPLWLFAYGSLIWKPAFEHVELRSCKAFGWRRSFCLEIRRWRGTPEQPGLMMCLDYGGCCQGIGFRLPGGNDYEQVLRLLRREADYKGDLAAIRWIEVQSGSEKFRALAVWAAPRNDASYVKLPIERQAYLLARAAGHVGTCAEYLHNTIVQLHEHGIHDTYLWRLQELVADEIHRMRSAKCILVDPVCG